ncbi:hypothetical protein Dalk_5227 [Desulfatibacillum aliphaticivorans]|uniref:Uncharacterized protein n=1 Tax=Desulfatibacillum aliphaticivorans TaxID=218208 RepID=B8FEB6_DESAL|nr:hypothetical protein [Desulfatibacillum aliphaticivorans]ACL06897.1 hypothetical protein Dalk_5227 [Desulfatibacillum aliphaticivorans]
MSEITNTGNSQGGTRLEIRDVLKEIADRTSKIQWSLNGLGAVCEAGGDDIGLVGTDLVNVGSLIKLLGEQVADVYSIACNAVPK